ncbi:MAG: hypothetical protein LBI53_07340 [Candidatus Peribacteria bacterium]|jgi:hypothetical protein|nr:hypothetical protein [Candidatus Peribacteria bacterium]
MIVIVLVPSLIVMYPMLFLSIPLEIPFTIGGSSSETSSTSLILDTLDPMMMLFTPAADIHSGKIMSLSLKHLTGRRRSGPPEPEP